MDACKQLMERDLLGTRRFAVVRDDFEQHQVGRFTQLSWVRVFRQVSCHRVRARALQDRMHLDCVFSILSESVCIMLEEMIGEDSPTKR
jgi:hypothetical protein